MAYRQSDPIGWKQVWEINRQFIGGSLGLGLGWLCWRMPFQEEFWWIWVLSGILMASGAVSFAKALIQIVRLLWGLRRWGRYQRQGTTPRADQMAREQDLVKMGRRK